MSGTIRGTLEAVSVQANEFLVAGDVFKTFFDALEAHPNTTRIALYYGTGGTGTDYSGGANPFGNTAFAVWRFETTGARTWPFYVFLYTPSFLSGTNGGEFDESSAGTVNGTGYCMISACVGIGGDENPWNGTTNNDGTDTYTTKWATPAGGTAYVAAPHSNNVGQADAGSVANNLTVFTSPSATTSRYHFIFDDDGLIWVNDEADNGVGYRIGYIGLYEPAPHLTVARPFCAIRTQTSVSQGTLGDDASVIIGADGNPYNCGISWDSTVFTTTLQPDEQAGSVYVPQRIQLYSTDAIGGRGLMGWLPSLLQIGYNIPTLDSDLTLSRVAFGEVAVADTKVLIPWDGVTTPGSGTTKQGTTF